MSEAQPELPLFLRPQARPTVVSLPPPRRESRRPPLFPVLFGALSVVTCACLYVILAGWQCTSTTKLARATQAIMGADYQVLVCSRER